MICVYAYSIGERLQHDPLAADHLAVPRRRPAHRLLLFVQGISELLKSFWAARTGEVLVHHEKIEL